MDCVGYESGSNSVYRNANIFTYDYDAMKSSRDALAEDLMKERFHPKHIDQFESWGFD